MKKSWMSFVAIMAIATAALAQGSSKGADDKRSRPVLSFDTKGRLVHVVTPDGRHCMYRYGGDGRLVSAVNPSCGEPQQWMKAKRGS
jgi:YD repeat-containing protein